MSQEQYEYEVLREIYPLPRITAKNVLDFNERARIKCQEVFAALENTHKNLELQSDGSEDSAS